METKKYVGVKVVDGVPMTRLDYCKYRNWELPDDENGSDEGYLIEYENSSNSNHPNHKGYISWCPKKEFDNANRPIDGMTYGHAIEMAKLGYKIARLGWNGKGMFVFIREGRKITGVESDSPMGGDFESCSHFCMKDAQGKCVVGWIASQTDTFAEDWMVVK